MTLVNMVKAFSFQKALFLFVAVGFQHAEVACSFFFPLVPNKS